MWSYFWNKIPPKGAQNDPARYQFPNSLYGGCGVGGAWNPTSNFQLKFENLKSKSF